MFDAECEIRCVDRFAQRSVSQVIGKSKLSACARRVDFEQHRPHRHPLSIQAS